MPSAQLPAAYMLGLVRIPREQATTTIQPTQFDMMMKMIMEQKEQIEKLTTIISTMQQNGKAVNTAANPIRVTDHTDASRNIPETSLYSRVHVEKPSHTIAWAKMSAACPPQLKKTFNEMRKEAVQEDRNHRRNQKKIYSGRIVRVFVDGIPRYSAQRNEQGNVIRTRLQRTESFLQIARIQMHRVHAFFARGRRTFEFAIQEDYEDTFRAQFKDLNCHVYESAQYNPDAPRNLEGASDDEIARVREASLEQYVREVSRATATNAGKEFYRNKGIALVGEDSFNIALQNWSPYRRSAPNPEPTTSSSTTHPSRIRQRSESRGPESELQRKLITQDIQATTQHVDVEMNQP